MELQSDNDSGFTDSDIRIDEFDFRRIHPNLLFGTASDRYAGWIGQIYDESWQGRTRPRKRTLGGKRYVEATVPVETTAEYFEHYTVVELDFTFYRPILDAAGDRSQNHFVLDTYAESAPPSAQFLLKAPQAFSARVLRRGGGYERNEDYLDAEGFVRRFLEPAADILEDRLRGIIFEQEYQRVAESPDPLHFVSELQAFFDDVPRRTPIHLEVRSEHLLVPEYFDFLTREGLGSVFSHWTWLPSIKRQWELAGERFTHPEDAIIRLLTPRGKRYSDAYAMTHPFDRAVEELSGSDGGRQMVDETVALALHAIRSQRTLSIVANNRAWGNAPALSQAIAHRFMDFADRVRQ